MMSRNLETQRYENAKRYISKNYKYQIIKQFMGSSMST